MKTTKAKLDYYMGDFDHQAFNDAGFLCHAPFVRFVHLSNPSILEGNVLSISMADPYIGTFEGTIHEVAHVVDFVRRGRIKRLSAREFGLNTSKMHSTEKFRYPWGLINELHAFAYQFHIMRAMMVRGLHTEFRGYYLHEYLPQTIDELDFGDVWSKELAEWFGPDITPGGLLTHPCPHKLAGIVEDIIQNTDVRMVRKVWNDFIRQLEKGVVK